MTQKKTRRRVYSVKIFASIGAFFAILGLILSFLPLRMFALIPASISIYFVIIAYVLTRVFKTEKKFVYTVFGIAVLSMVIAGISELASSDVVEVDKEFEQKLDVQSKDVDSSLNAAFEEEIVVEQKPVAVKSDTVKSRKKAEKPVEVVEEEFVEEEVGDIEF